MQDGLGARIATLVDGDEPVLRARRLASFEQGFVLVVGGEYWLRAIPKWGQLAAHYDVLLAVATVACVAVLAGRGRRVAFLALAASHVVLLWTEYPASGNHAYLELYVCLIAALLRPDDPGEARLELRALRWLAVIVLFYSGVQKLAHGYWVNGEYLAFALGSETYRALLGWLVPDGELARLARLRGEVGDGPYRIASSPLVVLSNLTWVGEIVLALGLMWRRTRRVALVLALVLLAAIELVAREVFFGLVFASLLLLFARRDRQTPARAVIAVVLVLLLLVRLGVLPEVAFY